jgi:hypothetical protein
MYPRWQFYNRTHDTLPWEKDFIATQFASKLQRAVPELLSGELGLERIDLSARIPFILGTEQSSSILVSRASVRDVYDEALRQMGVHGMPIPSTAHVVHQPSISDPPIRRAIVEGCPGIGKTFGLLHALRRLLVAGKVVAFDDAFNRVIYAFIPSRMETVVSQRVFNPAEAQEWRGDPFSSETYTVYKLRYNNMKGLSFFDNYANQSVPLLQNPDAYLLLYSMKGYERTSLVAANTIIACYPDERQLGHFKMQPHQVYYVPMCTLLEITRMLQSDALGPVGCDISERFGIVGGNLSAFKRDDFDIIKADLDCLMAPENIKSEYALKAAAQSNDLWIDMKSSCNPKLYRYHVSYPYHRKSIRSHFVSSYVKLKIGSMIFPGLYRAGVCDKKIWETTCAVALSLGDSFRVKRLVNAGCSEPSEDPLALLEVSQSSTHRSLLECVAPKDTWMSLPYAEANPSPTKLYEASAFSMESQGFDLADLVLHRDVGFVCLTSKTLPRLDVIRYLLDNIVEATAERPLRLYHCLNESEFNKWTFAPEPLGSQWTAEAAGPLHPRLRQFALCIPQNLPI